MSSDAPQAQGGRLQRVVWMAAGAGLLMLAMLLAGMAFMYSGLYNVAANSEHTAATYWVLERGMRASVWRRAADIQVPDLSDPQLLRIGAHCYHVKCTQCHGAPGIAPGEIGLTLLPIPKNLTQTARDWPPEQLYWVTRNGIRMAGMPAWGYRISDRDIWAIVAFVDRQLPLLTVNEYQELVRAVSSETCSQPSIQYASTPSRGLLALRQYGCHGCHTIPGVTGPDIQVGPPLRGFARRATIAGVLPNTRENLIRWLRAPQSISARTLMPDLGITEQHAQDMAAYLETLE